MAKQVCGPPYIIDFCIVRSPLNIFGSFWTIFSQFSLSRPFPSNFDQVWSEFWNWWSNICTKFYLRALANGQNCQFSNCNWFNFTVSKRTVVNYMWHQSSWVLARQNSCLHMIRRSRWILGAKSVWVVTWSHASKKSCQVWLRKWFCESHTLSKN